MVPKHHYVGGHLGAQAELVNPKFVQTYGSESLVGKICLIYKSSQNGPFAAGLQDKILSTYRLGMLINYGR